MIDCNKIPKEPPRDISSFPGLKYTSIISKGDMIAVLLICLIFCILPILMVLSKNDTRLLLIDMMKVNGVVLKVSSLEKDKKNQINYSFKTKKGNTYYGKSIICTNSEYSSLKVNDPLTIIYDPDDPIYNGIDGELGKNSPIKLIMIFPLFGLLLSTFIIYPLPQIKRNRSIFKKGIVTNGEIVFVKDVTEQFNKGLQNMDVFFRFKCLDGSTIESKIFSKNYWLLNQLKVGDPITVAYMKNKPKKSIILDFFYR